MGTINVTPLVLKDMVMQLDGDNYERAISAAVFTPSASAITWQGGTPDSTFTDVSTASWVAAITAAQDWDNPVGLMPYLYAKEGARVPALFKPKRGSGASFSSTLIITPGAIGGTVNAVSEATVNLGCQGKPVLIPAVAAVPRVDAASAAGGPVAGGNLIKVTGAGFTGTTSVKFGAVVAPNFTVDNDGVLWVIAPAAAAGSKPITVTNATGVSVTSAAYVYA